jgi:hypothetical protein
MDNGQFYIHRDGEQYGPYSKQDLGNMAQRSELLPDDLIWCEGMPDWQSAQALFPAPSPPPPGTVGPKAKTNKLVAPLVIGFILVGLSMLWLVLQTASTQQSEAVAAAKVAASPTPPPQPLGGPLGMTRQEIAVRFGPHEHETRQEEDRAARKSIWDPIVWKQVPIEDKEITWRDPKNTTVHTKNGVNITVSYFNGRADLIEYTVNSRSDVVDILGTFGDYKTSWHEIDTSGLNNNLRQLRLQGSYPADRDSTHYKWQSQLLHPGYGLAFADYSVGFRKLSVETEERVNRLRRESSEKAQSEERERSERFKGL